MLHWRDRRRGLLNTYTAIDPDIILINSHGLPDNETLHIPQYRVHRKNSSNTHTDGTAIAVKHNTPHRIIDTFISDTLAVEIDTTTGKIIIATLYQPPARPYIPTPDFIQLFRRNTPVYMLADLNANHPAFGYKRKNVAGTQLYNLMLQHTLQHRGPYFPTYLAANTSTTPDIFLTNFKTYHNIHIEAGPLTTSDHLPIILTISASPIQVPTPPRPNYNQADWDNFKGEIEREINRSNFTNPATLEEIDDGIDSWYNTILTATSKHIPTTHHRTLPTPQHSHHTKLIMVQFSNLRTYAQIHGWTRQLYQRYRMLQQRLQEDLTKDANTQWSDTILQTSLQYRDPKTFWRKIRNLTGETIPTTHYLLDANNRKHYTPQEQEILHREVWQEVFGDDVEEDEENEIDTTVRNFLEENVDRITPYHSSDLTRLNSDNPLTEIITDGEVHQIIKQLRKTCPGQSGINKTILSHLPRNAISRLSQLYNSTLSAGYFPDRWKESIIRLIPKTGKPVDQALNYRPISLLEVPGKILEKIVNTRLRYHLEDNNQHHPNQFGFRQDRGTTHALALITESIAQYKAHRGQCHLVLRDITKAFDKVWHLGLKYKILHLNLPEVSEKLLCDFLDDRTARIKVGTYIGDQLNLRCGVPQGSVLSPTLFITFTRDLPPPSTGNYIAYADDVTQITGYGGRSKEIMNRKTERDIEKVNDFERKWKIKTNINKFTPLRLGNINGESLVVDGEAVEFQKEGKTLGLKITRTGYKKHIDDRRRKAMGSLTKLFRLREMPTKIKTHLVKALVLPVLEYPPIPTQALSNRQISRLQKIQNKALRFATNQRYPYTMNTRQIHEYTRTKPINIKLHQRATKIWKQLEDLKNPTYENLRNNLYSTNRYSKWFPSSLAKSLGREPIPRYK